MLVVRVGRLISPAVAAVIFALGLFLAPAQAQEQPGFNPTAQSVNEQQLLQELQRIEGRVSIPDTASGVLQQPQGRDYRQFHEGALPWIGGIVILGMLILLAAVYFMKGPIRTEGEPSGVKIRRYNMVERVNHWMTATAFIVLAITGLNYFFGKRLIMPLIGPDAFSTWSIAAKFAHNFVSWPFMLGILIMLIVWIKDNLPDRYDWPWLKAGGGMIGDKHPPAGRFNAGQKLIFWAVIVGGIALSVTGIMMLFPFSFADINGMQWAQYVHAVIGVLLIVAILVHIYTGTLGVEGSITAMGTGEVDANWARIHHSAWLDKQQAKRAGAQRASIEPAE